MLEIINQKPLVLPEMQRFHSALDKEKGFDGDFVRNVAYLVAEVGEALNEFRHLSKQTEPEQRTIIQERVGEELADCLAYVVKLANYAEIDLEVAYIDKMRQNISRTWE